MNQVIFDILFIISCVTLYTALTTFLFLGLVINQLDEVCNKHNKHNKHNKRNKRNKRNKCKKSEKNKIGYEWPVKTE